MPDAPRAMSVRQVAGRIPLRCLCGNAVLRGRLEHETDAAEVVTSLCPECDTGDFEETFYTDRDGKMLTWSQWMERRGLEP